MTGRFLVYVLFVRSPSIRAMTAFRNYGGQELRAKGSEKIFLNSGGACVGCSVAAAARLFPAAQKDAAAYGLHHVITLHDLGAVVSYADPQTAVFTYEVPGGERVDGIALYPAFNGVPFLQVTAVMSAADQALVPWILHSALGVRR